MPPDFRIPPVLYQGRLGDTRGRLQTGDLYVPLEYNAYGQPRGTRQLAVVARLRTEVGLAQAQAEMSALAEGLAQTYPNNEGWAVLVVSLSQILVGNLGPQIGMLKAAVGLVLLIACANITNLLLARGEGRRAEMAIRAAMGGGRRRLVRQMLTESLMLAALGGIVGLSLAVWGNRMLVTLIPTSVPRGAETSIDGTVLAFALLVTVGTAVLFGLAPAWRGARVELRDAMSRSSGQHRRETRLPRILPDHGHPTPQRAGDPDYRGVGTGNVAIINQTLAQRLWPDDDPLGKRITFYGPPWMTVVGVVADTEDSSLRDRTGDDGSLGSHVYHLGQFPYMDLMVRTRDDPLGMVEPVENAILELDPTLPVGAVTTLEQMAREDTALPRFYALMVGIFAGVALLLAAVGLYGVVAYTVSQRTRELGLRMALGASQARIRSMVVRLTMGAVALGLTLGTVGAVALAPVLGRFLYGMDPVDPVTFVGVALVLAAVAMAASYLPARRASRMDPMWALRHE